MCATRMAASAALVVMVVLGGITTCPGATGHQKISYRLPKSKTAHFATKEEADSQLKTLKQLGCQASQHQHDGHIDVRYQCPQWQTITLKNPQEVATWQRWLRGRGFATVHNTPPETHRELIKYRLPSARTYHFHKPDQAKSHVAMMKMLGCEVRKTKHAGHDDIIAECAGWRTIGLADHKEAHHWETTLKKLGFHTVHQHGSARTAQSPGTNRARR